MKDLELEAKLRLLNIQLDIWKKLHNLMTYGLDKFSSYLLAALPTFPRLQAGECRAG